MDRDEYDYFLHEFCVPFAKEYIQVIEAMHELGELRPEDREILAAYERSPAGVLAGRFVSALYGCLVAEPGTPVYQESLYNLEHDIMLQYNLNPKTGKARAAFAEEFLKSKPASSTLLHWLDLVEYSSKSNQKLLMENGAQATDIDMLEIDEIRSQTTVSFIVEDLRPPEVILLDEISDLKEEADGLSVKFALEKNPPVLPTRVVDWEEATQPKSQDMKETAPDEEFLKFKAIYVQNFLWFEELFPEAMEEIREGYLSPAYEEIILQYEDQEDMIVPNLQIMCNAPLESELSMKAHARVKVFLEKMQSVCPEEAEMTAKIVESIYNDPDRIARAELDRARRTGEQLPEIHHAFGLHNA